MPSDTDPTADESLEKPTSEQPVVERRPLLKALGVGATLSLGSGIAAADAGASRQVEIDPNYGYPTPDAEDIPEELAPDHEVELHTSLPENPENPARPPFFHFEPSGLHVQSGDIVQFTLTAPDHTITAYHPGTGFQQRVPDGVPPFSSPVLNVDGAWLYRFDEEGLYDMYCGPHHVFGMNMRIVVGELSEADVPGYEDTFEGSQDPPLLAPFSKEFLEHDLNAPSDENEDAEWTFLTPQEILDAPSLDPSAIQEQGSVSFEAVLGDIDRFGDEVLDHDEAATPTVQVREHAEHGDILVGPDEMTLYMFLSDGAAGESTCYADCAEAWPPLTVDGEPVAGDDVTADLATVERRTGETQVMASNWPLYNFAQDEEPGDANGQGVNNAWWVLAPDGSPIRS